MGKSKQKRKSTREPQLSAKSIVAIKISKQDVVHRMVVTSLESKTRGDVYGNLKNHQLCHFCYPIDDREQTKLCSDKTQAENN